MDGKSHPLLHDVIISKNKRLAKFIPLLIAKGANINARNKRGETALWSLMGYYVAGNDLSCFQLLLDLGARVNKVDKKSSWSLLGLALFRKNYDLAALFLKYGAVVSKNIRDIKYKKIPQTLKETLQQKYQEQQCCICLEHPDDLLDIPCENRCKEYLCKDCYEHLPHSYCPMCRGKLGEFDE